MLPMSSSRAERLGDDMNKPPQTFEEYGHLDGPETQRRAKEAGCKTVAEMVDWVDKHYGD